MPRTSLAARSESGSIPLSLIVVIAAAGLMSVLVVSLVSAQRQVRFDRDFTQALPVADSGLAVAQTRLTNGESFISEVDGTDKPFREFAIGEQSAPETGTLDGEDFTWHVERVSPTRWEVVSSSIVNGTERTIVGTLQEQPEVALAAFADDLITMRGANYADSYNSAAGGEWCTGFGIVGGNDEVDFQGRAQPGDRSPCPRPDGRTVDRVDLYDWENFADPARCDTGHPNCQELTYVYDGTEYLFDAPLTIDPPLDLATDESLAFIKDALDACEADEELQDFVASADLDEEGGVRVLEPADNAEEAVNTGNVGLPGGHYCFESLDFDEDTKLADSASADNPVIIFVRNEVLISGNGQGQQQVDVGCIDCEPGNNDPVNRPEAARLRIYVETGGVTMNNNTQFAGIMYAPRAECAGGAQVNVYGSLVCKDIGNQGGWRFHYDDALRNIGNGQFAVAAWREELPGG